MNVSSPNFPYNLLLKLEPCKVSFSFEAIIFSIFIIVSLSVLPFTIVCSSKRLKSTSIPEE